MKSAMRSAMVAVLLAAGAACDVAADESGRAAYAGEPYRGRVSAQVSEPGRSSTQTASGTGSAEFAEIGGGRSRLTVTANLRKPGDAGFVIEGSSDASGWRGRADDLRLVIDRNGTISGGGTVDRHRVVFGGQATAHKLDLRVEMDMLARSDVGVYPVGTRTVFDYALKRDGARADAGVAANAAPDRKTKKTCKRRIWKMRNVATPGGGMTMTQVPHCLD